MNPNQMWRYVEPGENGEVVECTFSEQQIIDFYYPYWSEQMRKVDKADQITPDSCIDDWVVVNWAEKVPDAQWAVEEMRKWDEMEAEIKPGERLKEAIHGKVI